jgi:hypothetical protein
VKVGNDPPCPALPPLVFFSSSSLPEYKEVGSVDSMLVVDTLI